MVNGRRTKPGLTELQYRSHQFGVPADKAAHPCSARAVPLGHAVHQYRPVFDSGQIEDARVLGVVLVDELAVRLVADEEESVLDAQTRKHLQFQSGVNRAGRVARVGIDDCPGPASDGPFELGLGRQGKAGLGQTGYRDELDAGGCRESRIVGVERLRHDDFVTGVGHRVQRERYCLAAAGRNKNVLGPHLYSHTAIVLNQRVNIVLQALRRPIGKHLDIGVPVSVHHLGRGLDIRLADVQVIDLDAAGLGPVGIRHQPSNRRRRHLSRPAGKSDFAQCDSYHVRSTDPAPRAAPPCTDSSFRWSPDKHRATRIRVLFGKTAHRIYQSFRFAQALKQRR